MFKHTLKAALIAAALMATPGFGADTPAPQGLRGDFLTDLNALEKKFESLADAMPADKLAYHPGDKVRSTGEVFKHVIQANYYFAGALESKAPAKAGDMSVTDKAQIASALKDSFASLRQAATKMSDADLDKEIGGEGRKMSERTLLLRSLGHLHEHLGQLIAYARGSGVTPPWSMDSKAE